MSCYIPSVGPFASYRVVSVSANFCAAIGLILTAPRLQFATSLTMISTDNSSCSSGDTNKSSSWTKPQQPACVHHPTRPQSRGNEKKTKHSNHIIFLWPHYCHPTSCHWMSGRKSFRKANNRNWILLDLVDFIAPGGLVAHPSLSVSVFIRIAFLYYVCLRYWTGSGWQRANSNDWNQKL